MTNPHTIRFAALALGAVIGALVFAAAIAPLASMAARISA